MAKSRAGVDWSVMRGALTVLALSILIAGAVLGASYYFREAMEQEFSRHQARFQDVSRRYLAVDEEERIIKTRYPRFVELYNHGVIGDEARLSWVEVLRSAARRIALPELRYQIASREEVQPEFDVATGRFQIYASTMELRVGLLHEGDFAALTEMLDEQALGLYHVERCSFDRVTVDIEPDPNRANINAQCRLKWYTVDLRGAEEIVL